MSRFCSYRCWVIYKSQIQGCKSFLSPHVIVESQKSKALVHAIRVSQAIEEKSVASSLTLLDLYAMRTFTCCTVIAMLKKNTDIFMTQIWLHTNKKKG